MFLLSFKERCGANLPISMSINELYIYTKEKIIILALYTKKKIFSIAYGFAIYSGNQYFGIFLIWFLVR